MRELEEVNCEIRNVIEIQQFMTSYLSNIEGDGTGSLNGSQICNGVDDVYGGFLNDAAYAWLGYGCHLIILNTKSGENCSSWTFRGRITCVCQFPAHSGELPLLLVGLDNEATRTKDSMGLLCVFDCTTSRVLRAIRMPAGVEQVCIVSGGAEWEEFNDKRPDNILTQMDGIACVVLRNLHHLMIDLQRSSWEIPESSVLMDEVSPAEIEFITTKDSFHRNQTNKNKHMACNLLNRRIETHIGFNREDFESNVILDEKLTTSVISSTKIGCLISGCLGRVIIWQNDGSVGWISSPVDETMVVTQLALLEPTDDPRPFYYLWVVFQDDTFKVPPLLRMYALLFERKYSDKRTNFYFNLEAEPCLKFEFKLDTADRVVSLSTIERETNLDQTESEFRRSEESLLLISTTNRTLLFDLNQWYKEQMPQTINECKNPNSILACYDTKHRPSSSNRDKIISSTYVLRSLQEFPNNNLSLSEEIFYPNSLSLEWIELSLTKLTFWLTRGVQNELLREIALTGPIILTQPSEMFHKCLSVGLIPFNTEVSFSSDQNVQRDMILSLCLEQRWTTFLIKCAKEWSDGSAAYMYPNFLKWGIQRASSIKLIADRLCVPLFDQSGNSIGESDVKTLRFCYQQLECLSNVVAKLPFETSSLMKQRKALKRVSMYFQVLLWFYDVGLLPETQSLEEGSLPISLSLKIPYPFEKLYNLYKEKRESIRDDNETDENVRVFFIDELITRECPALNLQWEKEAGDTNTNGNYPPPSLQSLLRSYLTDCDQAESDEIECKHQIIIYLLMDLAMLLQGSYPGVDQLIKYPSSFKLSPSLIKLTQAFWLLDHEDYHGFLDMMTGQLVRDSDVKPWHHKLVLRTLIRNNQHKLALMYLRIKKPPLSSVQEQSTLIGLSVEHGLIQSAFHHRPQSHYAQLLTCFFQACKTYNKLSDILHLALDSEEEEMFVKFLEDTKSEDTRLLYYLQRCRYMEANNGRSFDTRNLHTDMLNAYNATLPDVVKRFSMNMGKTSFDTGLEPRYPKPMSHTKNSQQITNIYETMIRKAKETCPRGERSFIPFVTAPCTSLRLNDDRININCVVSPKVVQKSRKRSFDRTMEDEEDSGMRTPDRTKRRKLLDEGEAALNAAFSTPLVKRKVSSSRDTPSETPHSILKIRQLIRNSTSPTIGSLQGDTVDGTESERKRKINRQIRFSISQSKKNNAHDETNAEEDGSKVNASEGSDEVSLSPTINEKSLTESTVLSDSSYTCKNVYTPRPRPSLRRTYLQTPTESINESRKRISANSNLSNSSNFVENCSKLASEATPRLSRTCTELFSSSIHSSAVLSPNSSFEVEISLKRSLENNSQLLKFSKQQNNYNSINSTVLRNSSRSEEQYKVEEDNEVQCTENRSESTEKLNFQFGEDNRSREDVLSKCRNGDLSKARTLEADNEENDHEEEFEHFSNATENKSALSGSKERWSVGRKLQNQSRQENENLNNGEHFGDITEDESSKSGDEDKDKEKDGSQKIQMKGDNMYDASNITDDESDSSTEIIESKRNSIAISNKQENVDKLSDKKKYTRDDETIEKSICLDNNNSSYRETVEKAVHDSQKSVNLKDDVNTSNLDNESLDTSQNITPRVTRSRRASSIAKEINISPLNSPTKVIGKTPRSRRASSLMKEVLIASIAPADEEVRQTASSGSEESSPKRGRRRATSVTKDVSEKVEDEEVKAPVVRRSTRRAASVQKELSESNKPLAKNSKVSLSSEPIMEDEKEKLQTETKKTKARRGSVSERKPGTPSKSMKESKLNEEKGEEMNLKATRKHGSSVPKEAMSAIRTRRSSSVVKEDIPEDVELLEKIMKERHVVDAAVNSPAANTRSRRLSIQSVPEELEEVLSVPSKERATKSKATKQSAQTSRQRRATSVEPYQAESKRITRSTRGKDILKEVIVEEEVPQMDSPGKAEASGVKKVPTKRKRTSSTTVTTQEDKETTPRSRRGRKTKNQGINDQFLFSQPDKPGDSPLDEKAIGEVPKYVFSPPHTRSKAIAPDYRRMKNFIPILNEDEIEEEEKEEERQSLQKSSKYKKTGQYTRVTTHRYRTKFVLPKRSKSTSD
nr:protein ELYS isoform X2 [Osmia lignaria]